MLRFRSLSKKYEIILNDLKINNKDYINYNNIFETYLSQNLIVMYYIQIYFNHDFDYIAFIDYSCSFTNFYNLDSRSPISLY